MAKAPWRVPEGREPLGGSGGIPPPPPRNFFKFGCAKVPSGEIWGDLKGQICKFLFACLCFNLIKSEDMLACPLECCNSYFATFSLI